MVNQLCKHGNGIVNQVWSRIVQPQMPLDIPINTFAHIFSMVFHWFSKAPFPAHAQASKGAWRLRSISCRSRCQQRRSLGPSSAAFFGASPAPGSYVSGGIFVGGPLGMALGEKMAGYLYHIYHISWEKDETSCGFLWVFDDWGKRAGKMLEHVR